MSTSRHVFAERLRILRAKSQKNQDQLSTELGVSQNLIGKWERGESEPNATLVARIATLFGVSCDYLCGNSDFPLGLAPDDWLLDLDVIDARSTDELWCLKIPRRFRVCTYAEMKRIEDAK